MVASELDAPHRDVLCTECHGASGEVAIERGASHAFGIDRARCSRCHDGSVLDALFASREVLASAARARADALELETSGPHARVMSDSASARNAALVLGDRGAWAHAPRYARRLLGAGP